MHTELHVNTDAERASDRHWNHLVAACRDLGAALLLGSWIGRILRTHREHRRDGTTG